MSVTKTGSLDQALNRLLVSKDLHVKAGVLENSKYPDGTSVPTVAYKNEYGWANIPPRPFFRNTIKEQKANWGVLARNAIKAGYNVEKVLGLVGAQMQTDVQFTIMTFTTPPNAPYTVAKKGFQAPLRQSLLMHDSIKYEIVEGKL